MLHHGNGGTTYVPFLRNRAPGFTGDGAEVQIPTDAIPIHLRKMGTELLIIVPRFEPEKNDTLEEIRKMCAQIEVLDAQEVPDSN